MMRSGAALLALALSDIGTMRLTADEPHEIGPGERSVLTAKGGKKYARAHQGKRERARRIAKPASVEPT